MADTFGTIAFTVLASGQSRQQNAQIAVTHIPGTANTNYIDFGGLDPLRLSYNLLLNAANFALLEGTVGGTAQLVTSLDGTITSAQLTNCQRALYLPSGSIFANTSFLVVTA